MKKQSTRSNNTTYFALLFFAAMTVVGVTTAHAQDTINPLVATTGPNVLGAGRIEWNSSLDFYHSSSTFNENDYSIANSYGATTGLRFGIGNRAELTFDVSGNYSFLETNLIDGHHTSTNGAGASVGAKLLLSDGRRWLPQVAFFTHVGVNNEQYAFNRSGNGYSLPLGTLEPGQYAYTASTTLAGKRYTASGNFIVEDINLEQVNHVADHALLNTIAQTTGAQMLYPDQLDQLPQLLAERDDLNSVVYAHTSYTELLNLPLLFILIVLLLAAEWGIRKWMNG